MSKRLTLRDSPDGITYAALGSTDDLKKAEGYDVDRHVAIVEDGRVVRRMATSELMAVGADYLEGQRARSVKGAETKRDKAEGRKRRVRQLAQKHRVDHEYDPKTRLGSTRGMAHTIADLLPQFGEIKNVETGQEWRERTIRADLGRLRIR